MFSTEELERIRRQGQDWRTKNSGRTERKSSYKTLSQIPTNTVYTPEDLAESDYLRDVGLPGEFPYLRGVHPGGYRDRLWTMRMFAGFGLPQETNERFRFLLGKRGKRASA